ncbi:MAG: hypothetical protein KF729_06145 [Sandaracinaceae bacterium]|nr:hypothetical protein [Sandaracinaceae bacterium]
MDGLDASGLGETASARRRGLAGLSDDALGERLAALASSLSRLDAAPIAEAAGLPLGEVVASPFALRMVALGLEAGAVARPRELRRLIDWTEALAPEVRDPDHDAWDRGVLRTGKYQAFMAESPVALFDPAHVSKWGPHEMLHRAAGFFFRPGMTRWELYLGARLNELLPVTTFYGAEQAMRLDEGAFEREAAGRRPRARPEDTRWRTDAPAALVRRARESASIFRAGLEHFERELGAIDEELARGVRVRAAHPFLDTSSDATAYVAGHYARLAQPAVARALASHGVDRVERYRDAIEALFDRLLFGVLPDAGDPAAARRVEARDLVLRAAHLGEGVEHDLEPLFDVEDPDVIRVRLPGCIGDEEAALVLLDGSPRGRDVAQLAEGLAQVLPRTVALAPELAAGLAAHAALCDRGPLAERAVRFLEGEGDAARAELARLEAAIATAARDDAIEWLASPEDERSPDALDACELFAHRGVIRLEATHDVASAHAGGGEPSPGAQTLLVAAIGDAVAVVDVPPEVADAIDALRARAAGWTLDPAWARELLASGVLGARPRRPA